MADGSRFLPNYNEAPFLIIEERVGHFKEKILQTDLHRKIIFLREGISSILKLKNWKNTMLWWVLLRFFSKLTWSYECFPFLNVTTNLPLCVGVCIHWMRMSLKLSYAAFFIAFFKMVNWVPLEVHLHLTWKFNPFNKCFLSQNVTENFSLMLL